MDAGGHIRPKIGFDMDRWLVTYGDKRLRFTAKEFKIICYLADNPGFIRTREQIMDACWDHASEFYGYDRNVDSNIKRIRNRFKKAIGFDPIDTHYSIGYSFREGLL